MAAGVSMTEDEVSECAISSWYSIFSDITIPSKFIPLTDQFIKYLLGDDNDAGLVLPRECSLATVDGYKSDSSDSSVSWDDEDEVDAPSFPVLVEAIEKTIGQLGGAVFPKLNWSSPRDATWVAMGNTLKCTCPSDVILLLKSSDFIMHDLSRVGEYCGLEQPLVPPGGYSLCLRRWVAINPSGEFRCFVKDDELIGEGELFICCWVFISSRVHYGLLISCIAISQRDVSSHYPHLNNVKDQLPTELVNFFISKLYKKFTVKNYTFDVYRSGQATYQLIDINPFCDMTDPLLFSWSELRNHDKGVRGLPVVRLVEHASHTIQPSDLIGCRMPKECAELISGGDDYVEKFVELCKSAKDDAKIQDKGNTY